MQLVRARGLKHLEFIFAKFVEAMQLVRARGLKRFFRNTRASAIRMQLVRARGLKLVRIFEPAINYRDATRTRAGIESYRLNRKTTAFNVLWFQLVEKASLFCDRRVPPYPPCPPSPKGEGGKIRGADAPCDLSREAPPPEPPYPLKNEI